MVSTPVGQAQRFQNNILIQQHNPYGDAANEDKTDLASSVEILKSYNLPNFGKGGAVSGSHEF